MLNWLSKVVEKCWKYICFWVIINPFENGVLVRLGKYKRILLPGFYLKFPFIDYVYSTIITPDTMHTSPVTLTTTDGKTVSIGAVVEFEIVNVYKYILCTNEPRSNMHDIILGTISEAIEDRKWEEIKKKNIRYIVQKKISQKCWVMGIEIIDFYFTNKCVVRSFKIFTEKNN